ncbi:SecDF P1 head subdomain-containing protein [Actinomadura sp. 9N407]|uniref:SecDF P1 head subdomain-containing protein n=1 Tax=Actinomadura sp. 9N407 TaxID=3375154 RepID=UPI0037A7C275
MRVVPRRNKDRTGPQDAAPRSPVPQQAPPITKPLPQTGIDTAELGPGPSEETLRRRARAAERRRAAADAKRSRTAQRQNAARQDKASREHRSSLLVMIVMLALLIAIVVVTGGLFAASMTTRPVTLASPLHIYPVIQTVPGQCPAGTQGITGQSAGGLACYQLSQGIAIRKVADLGIQKARTRGAYDVAVTLRTNDRRAFAALTRATLNRDLAFVVRDRLVTVPRVDTPILDGKVVITGPPNRAEANRLVRSLKGANR